VNAAIRRLEQHVSVVDASQPPLERLLSVHRLAHHQLGEPAGKPAVVVGAAKRPIESRRRNLERVREGERILDVEDRAHLAVDLLAIDDADALFRGRRRSRAIDEHTNDVARRFAAALDVPDGQPARRGYAFGNCPNVLQGLHCTRKADPQRSASTPAPVSGPSAAVSPSRPTCASANA
jgi:hypothetical protein